VGPRRPRAWILLLSAAFITGLPKAELHLHLEGAVSPVLLARLLRKHEGRDTDPDADPAAVEAWEFQDLAAFLRVYAEVCRCMRDRADFEDATYETLRRAAESQVRYVELFFSPDAHDQSVIDYPTMVDGIVAGIHAARRDFGLVAKLIPAHNRELGLERGLAFLDKVSAYRPDEVIGIGLDYAERPHPPATYAPLFAEARRRGLMVTAHAGEDGPADYVRDAIDLLGCRRIDHGYHVVDDPGLVARCRDLDILFTVCPTTTLHTTCWRDLHAPDHAIRRMLDAGLRITVNTDDPGLFGTTLNREYGLLADAFGLSESVLAQLAANGFSHSWNPGPTGAQHAC
jgi:adenosine deaminase